MRKTKYRALLVNDLRQIRTDPVLMASILGPVLLIAISRYALPPLFDWIEKIYSLSLSEHNAFVSLFLLAVIPILIGSLTGLLMLDDRDENMMAYLAVTPLARVGYIRYRLLFPSLLTLLMGSLYILMSGMEQVRPEAFYSVVVFLLEAPLIAMVLIVFASNKVEGLALTKATGLLFAGPVAAYVVPDPWTYVGALIPTYWPARIYMTGIADGVSSLGWFVGGLGIHIALLIALLGTWMKRTEP